MNLRDLNESNTVSGNIKKIKKIIADTVSNLAPEAWEIEKKSTDAGMGGYNYIQITFSGNVRKKDEDELNAVKSALSKGYKVEDKSDNASILTIEPNDLKESKLGDDKKDKIKEIFDDYRDQVKDDLEGLHTKIRNNFVNNEYARSSNQEVEYMWSLYKDFEKSPRGLSD